MASGSKTAVVSAITVNSFITVIKFIAAVFTHSASMMNEAVHSLMDTANQVFLFLGLMHGGRPADGKYAFGHGQKKYLWNLWSAIGLFSIGAGLGIAHAWHAYHQLGEHHVATTINLLGMQFDPIWISALVLFVALILEGYVLFIAGRIFLQRMREDGESNPFRFMLESDDPTLLAVVLEDSVAVLGVIFAALGIGLSRLTGNTLWDIGFSVVIAVMLGIVAFVLGFLNMRLLTNIRDHDAEIAFREIAKSHREVQGYHDLRSMIVDETNTLIVAEVELREETMIPGLSNRIQEHEARLLENIPEERHHDSKIQRYVNTRAVIQATLERTEQVIDEIESQLRARCPQIGHVTIEVEGIASPPESIDDTMEAVTV